MLESTTPFGNFRWLMSKSSDKTWGRGSALYFVNGIGWLLVFFAARVASIPLLLTFGVYARPLVPLSRPPWPLSPGLLHALAQPRQDACRAGIQAGSLSSLLHNCHDTA